MNTYEKLAMVLVPVFGLAGIIYFLNFIVPNTRINHLDKRQNNIVSHYSESIRNHNYKNKVNKTDNYIKWQGDKSTVYMSKPQEKKKYKSVEANYLYPTQNSIYTTKTSDLYIKQKQARLINKQKKQAEENQCNYIYKKKKEIKERMNRGYSSIQFKSLERKRKYWSKQYSDNCFNR